MKEKLTLRNVILWTVAFALIVLFVFSFGASVKLVATIEGQYVEYVFNHALWKTDVVYATGEKPITVPDAYRLSSGLGITAVLLFLLSAGGLMAVSLLVKQDKLKKILIFVCAGVILVGAVLLFFLAQKAWKEFANLMGTSVEQAKQMLAAYGFKAKSSYGTGAGIVGILFAVTVVLSQLVIPDVKFIKSK